ncbi:MAG: hypothetical protein P1P64_01285 [Treponemataceae bacterium]
MNICFRVLGIVYILGCLALFFYCFVFTGLSNHSSFDITSFIIWYGVAGFIIGLISIFFTSERKFGVFLILLALIILIFACISNVFNIMISYDTWVKRGMPEKYTFLF